MFRLFLDDKRMPYEISMTTDKWLIARNYTDFVYYIEVYGNEISLISLDHDLGDFDENGVERTGYDCICYLENIAMSNPKNFKNLKHITCHSANSAVWAKMHFAIGKILDMLWEANDIDSV